MPKLLVHLDLRRHFLRIVNSAETGFEKPHPLAFAVAIAGLPPTDDIWIVGDSLHADFNGARALGWQAILVRQPPATPAVAPAFQTLAGAAQFLINAPNTTIT